jgi:hypothetical protein
MIRNSVLASRFADQFDTLTNSISPLGPSLEFECRESIEVRNNKVAVFRRGIDRQDMHASVAHDLHMSGPEGSSWPPVRGRRLTRAA